MSGFTVRALRAVILLPGLVSLMALHGVLAHAQSTIVVPSGDVAALIAALEEANTNGQPTVVELAPGTYTLIEAHNALYGPNGLPPVLEDLTIEGNGAVIERDPAAPPFRFFAIPNPADDPGLTSGMLTLRNVTLRGGLAQGGKGGAGFGGGGGAGLGGAIFCRSAIALEGVIFESNTAQGGAGGADNGAGIGGGGGGMGGDGGNS